MYNGFRAGARPTWNVSDAFPNFARTPQPMQQASGPAATGGPKPEHFIIGVVLLLVAINVVSEHWGG